MAPVNAQPLGCMIKLDKNRAMLKEGKMIGFGREGGQKGLKFPQPVMSDNIDYPTQNSEVI